MSLGKIILFTTTAGFLLSGAIHYFFQPIRWTWTSEPAITLPPTSTAEEASVQHTIEEPNWAEFEARWAGAPDDIRELARAIARGETPALDQVEPAALSQGYHAPALDFERDGTPVPYLATLLQEAALAINTGAVKALLARGAEPNVNHAEALFIAIEQRTPGAPAFMLFPDFDASLPIVQDLLDAGADPNMQQYGFRNVTPLYLARSQKNLGSIIILLKSDANPWFKPRDSDGYRGSSFMESVASGAGSPLSAEILFRSIRSVKPPLEPDEQVQKVLDLLRKRIETFAMGTGPDSRHTAWRLDQALALLGPALDRTAETERIRAELTPFDYQADGGWYLAEDEIHSRYDAPLSVPDRGDQIWGP